MHANTPSKVELSKVFRRFVVLILKLRWRCRSIVFFATILLEVVGTRLLYNFAKMPKWAAQIMQVERREKKGSEKRGGIIEVHYLLMSYADGGDAAMQQWRCWG